MSPLVPHSLAVPSPTRSTTREAPKGTSGRGVKSLHAPPERAEQNHAVQGHYTSLQASLQLQSQCALVDQLVKPAGQQGHCISLRSSTALVKAKQAPAVRLLLASGCRAQTCTLTGPSTAGPSRYYPAVGFDVYAVQPRPTILGISGPRGLKKTEHRFPLAGEFSVEVPSSRGAGRRAWINRWKL